MSEPTATPTTEGVDLFVNEIPGYPEGLNIYPESYTIYLPEEDIHPLSEVGATTQE